MLILAFDTATSWCTVAVGTEKKVLLQKNVFAFQAHMEKLLPLIDSLLKEASLSLSNIDAIAVGIGPGSFTGVRIGVATAKGLAQALKISTIGVSTLDTLAYDLFLHPAKGGVKKDTVCSVMDAKRKQVYFAIYQTLAGKLNRLSKYQVASPEAFCNQLRKYKQRTILIGDALKVYGSLFQEKLGSFYKASPYKDWFPKASNLLALAAQKEKEEPSKIFPIYIRPLLAKEFRKDKGGN